MFELIKAGGWTILPIIICSLAAVTIIAERFWYLRRVRIVPQHLAAQAWTWLVNEELDTAKLQELKENSPLGELLALTIMGRHGSRAQVKERVEEAGRHIMIRLERYLNALGTIAVVSPLIGLLGTVIGMIKVFTVITVQGVGNAEALAGGISEALISTAAGLTVAIPAVIFHRYLLRRCDEFGAAMEFESLKLVDAMFSKAAQRKQSTQGK